MANAGQIRMLFGLAIRQRLDEDDLRKIAEDVSGRPSLSALTNAQVDRIIARLGGKSGDKGQKRDNNKMTPQQDWKIGQLEKELGWAGNAKRLQAFIQKRLRVDRREWLTKAQAHNLIEALKDMIARQPKGETPKGADLFDNQTAGHG
ncbi:regulatory protein GemA [Sporomusa sp. KB1]|jgi:hypothetical protein|uniref:regulatory protein GemA n=1 Tax=Sporomusa sp. KB1 TaxID=943346 RepID=UPI0011A11F24|nr:regulatory protein GemA [Sporomusa sp. KB1]TWH45914.1 uncharacterized protein DUF1018 [Sporomusa sp. KB1]